MDALYGLFVLFLSLYPLVQFFMLIIPALITGAYAAILYLLVEKIREERARRITPVALALLLFVLRFILPGSSGDYPFRALLDDSFTATIIALAVITPFQVVSERLRMRRRWAGAFIGGSLSLLYIGITLAIRLGSGISPGYLPSQTMVLAIQYFESFMITAAVSGFLLLVQQEPGDTGRYRVKLDLASLIVAALFLIIPSLFVGAIAIFLWFLIERLPGRWVPMVVPLVIAAILSIIGTWLAATSIVPLGWSALIDYPMLTLLILTLVMAAMFVPFAPSLPVPLRFPILFLGSVTSHLLLIFTEWLFRLREWLTPDPASLAILVLISILVSLCIYSTLGHVGRHFMAGPVPGDKEERT